MVQEGATDLSDRVSYHETEMPETEHHLDDKYTDGVWYDRMAGDFCQIREVDDTIGLFEPGVENFDEHGPYYTFDEQDMCKEDAIGRINTDFTKVGNGAVENPTIVVERALRLISRNDPNELMGIPEQESINLMYARQQVEISEV